MAQFEVALERTLKWEGGYVFDPADAGGETYCGISRRYWPQWEGWARVDKQKALPAMLDADPDLQAAVSRFYHERFWQPGFRNLPQELANHVFDCAVLNGTQSAVELLQCALNLLNREGTSWPDIAEDGKLGPKTDAAGEKALREGPDPLLRMYRALRAGYYIERLQNRPINERFARGWLARAMAT